MICWMDMTFCSRDDCQNEKCKRHPVNWANWTDKEVNPYELPISLSSFDGCEGYIGDNN